MKRKVGSGVSKMVVVLILVLLILHAGVLLLQTANRTFFYVELAEAWAEQNDRLEWISDSLDSMEARGTFDNETLADVWWSKVVPSLCTVNAPLGWWEEIGIP